MKRIETFQGSDAGFWPCLQTPQWQVAILNFAQEQALHAINKIEVHRETDEVFMLQCGQASLVAVDIENGTARNWQSLSMQRGVVYNVVRGVWHTVVMSQDARIFITENARTHERDVSYHALSTEEQATLQRVVKKTWEGS